MQCLGQVAAAVIMNSWQLQSLTLGLLKTGPVNMDRDELATPTPDSWLAGFLEGKSHCFQLCYVLLSPAGSNRQLQIHGDINSQSMGTPRVLVKLSESENETNRYKYEKEICRENWGADRQDVRKSE